MICGIYQITNIANGKIYIGSSGNIEHRWLQHKSGLRRGKHDNPYLQYSYNKYGSSNFQLNILEVCQPEDLVTIEQYYLDWLEPFEEPDQRGYNIARCAEAPTRGRKLTEEQRKIISERQKGKVPWNIGKKMSEEYKKKCRNRSIGKKMLLETRLKMSAAHKGKIRSRQHCLNISLAKKGKPIKPWSEERRANPIKPMTGKHHSIKTKEKIRLAHLGKPNRWAFSTESRAKLSIAAKGRKLTKEWKMRISISNTGKHHTEETKAKMSIAKKGKKRIPFTSRTLERMSIAQKKRALKKQNTQLDKEIEHPFEAVASE